MKAENQGGGLIGILRNLRKNKKEELRILVLGLDNSGKTTILKSLSNEVLPPSPRTSAPSHPLRVSISRTSLTTSSSSTSGTSEDRRLWGSTGRITSLTPMLWCTLSIPPIPIEWLKLVKSLSLCWERKNCRSALCLSSPTSRIWFKLWNPPK